MKLTKDWYLRKVYARFQRTLNTASELTPWYQEAFQELWACNPSSSFEKNAMEMATYVVDLFENYKYERSYGDLIVYCCMREYLRYAKTEEFVEDEDIDYEYATKCMLGSESIDPTSYAMVQRFATISTGYADALAYFETQQDEVLSESESEIYWYDTMFHYLEERKLSTEVLYEVSPKAVHTGLLRAKTYYRTKAMKHLFQFSVEDVSREKTYEIPMIAGAYEPNFHFHVPNLHSWARTYTIPDTLLLDFKEDLVENPIIFGIPPSSLPTCVVHNE